MVFVQRSDGSMGNWVAIGLGVLGVHICLYLAMRFAGVFHRVLGDSGTTLVTRIAGLLLPRSPCSLSPTRCVPSSCPADSSR